MRKEKELRKELLELYHTLHSFYGDVDWWPGESRFEIILGAVLTQQTNWTNVEKALKNLKNAGILTKDDKASIFRLLTTERSVVEELVKSSGFYKQKTERILTITKFLKEEFDGDLDAFSRRETSHLRASLLSLKGIGNETADSILLYVCEKPVFVVDSYTFRLLERLEIYKDPKKDYLALQRLFESSLEPDVFLYKQYHGLIVNFSKEFCRRLPLCEKCFLKERCPTSNKEKKN